jgi:hypothetical protein
MMNLTVGVSRGTSLVGPTKNFIYLFSIKLASWKISCHRFIRFRMNQYSQCIHNLKSESLRYNSYHNVKQ